MSQRDYRDARMACELVRNMLAGYDFAELLDAISRAHASAPLLDPTLYMQKSGAMDEDAKVFRAALAFLAAWPKAVTT